MNGESMKKIKRKVKEILEILEYEFRCVVRVLSDVFNVFPVRKNRIVFISFNGKQYSCNPRAISEKLCSDIDRQKFHIVWVFNDPDRFRGMIPDGITCIKKHSIMYPYFMKTASVIVTNARGYGMIRRRKNQIIIQTWHASNGYKKLFGDKGIAGKKSILACKDFSYCMSGCANMTKERIEGTFGFFGPIIKGTPRMDIIIANKSECYKEKIHREYGITEERKIVLYAPTYRSSLQKNFGLDYQKLISAIEKRFGGKWVLLVRMHYFVKAQINSNDTIIDATDYPDMQELLLASDVLVSDYSSCIWDYSYLNRPCFLFCSDLSEYEKKVNFNYPIETWGFPVCTNNEELERTILLFDNNNHIKNMKKHHEMMGSYEDGKATDRVLQLIKNVVQCDITEG